MKNKATHIGTCQFCGSQQKLPIARNGNALLADHGYTRDGGHYGNCPGQRRFPFEVSKDFITAEVSKTEEAIARHIPAVVPALDARLSSLLTKYRRWERSINKEGLTQDEANECAEYRRAVAHNQAQAGRIRFVAFHKPRIAAWVARPEALIPVLNDSAAKAKRTVAKAELTLAKKKLVNTKRDLTRLLESAQSLSNRFDSEWVKATTLEEFHLNRAYYDKVNDKVAAKCRLLSGTHASALKVAANIRTLFTDQHALDIASDLEKCNALLILHKDDFLKAEAAANARLN